MFAAEPAQAFVCLRCQIRLSRRQSLQYRRSLFQSSKPVLHDVLFGDVHSAVTETSTPVLPSSPNTHAPQRTPLSFRRLTLPGPGRNSPKDRTESLPIKSLGSDSEIIVLAERDKRLPKGVSSSSQITPHQEDSAEHISSRGSVRKVEVEVTVPAQEEVNKLIEEVAGDLPIFRRTRATDRHEPVTVSRGQYNKMASTLYDKFSRDQLFNYVRARQEAEQLERLESSYQKGARRPAEFPDGRLSTKDDESSYLSKSQWRPGTSPTNIRLPHETREPWYDRGIKNKMGLIERLLRVSWRLNTEEEIMSFGELELSMDPRSLSMLLSGEPSVLQTISNQHYAKIEAYRADNVVRITANRRTCLAVEASIRRKLSDKLTEEVDLKPVHALMKRRGGDANADLFQAKDLEEVERITGTTIEVIKPPKGNVLRIHHESWQSAADARRLVMALLDLPPTGMNALLANVSPTEFGILRPIGRSIDLPFRYRRRPLGRWIVASQNPQAGTELGEHPDSDTEQAYAEPRASDSVEARDPAELSLEKQIFDLFTVSPKSGPKAEEISEAFEAGARLPSQTSAKDYVPKSSIDVALGYVLHEPVGGTSSTVPLSTLSGMPKSSRVFSNAMPGLRQLLSHLHESFDTPKDSLCIRLTPPAWKATTVADFEQFPDLEIYCRLDQLTQHVTTSAMRFVYPPLVASVMLPQQAVDLRFMRTESVWVRKAFEIPAVHSFVGELKASVAGQGTIRAPASLRNLQVPIRKSSSSKKLESEHRVAETTDEKKEDEAKGGVDKSGKADADAWRFASIEYSFAGLEYSQQTTFKYKDYRVFYTNYEAGQIGGRRGELRMQMPSLEAQPALNQWEENVSLNPASPAGDDMTKLPQSVPTLTDFIGIAFELASLVTEGVQSGVSRLRTVEVEGGRDIGYGRSVGMEAGKNIGPGRSVGTDRDWAEGRGPAMGSELDDRF